MAVWIVGTGAAFGSHYTTDEMKVPWGLEL